VIRLANQTKYGLAGAVFTRDLEKAGACGKVMESALFFFWELLYWWFKTYSPKKNW
jgi:acyl-CoA reductase-like NAD-dependent aldehyde dehydrogenase